ncbi:MAG: carbamoyl-phosphate synthase large subunit [Chloroflexi bacterium AL-W]|nr:carbamoyl-phosphate synthase large subunit [Chloroflexi bacterium AL-N1]NOK67148.1 carbamoyl-phosphate synthase large subunit [Chloroflexi bacterium AL-N10]NOK74559.1 carbamoyl-phosphate synthase large subunit [Chloroflexi bacterium AL-N5]NOK81750.1 carbamoyl-phosphate synthase large subunit [Chloroflexi bacterium AL-W]NOK89220.1 carbamoyl-phosphate synthase large subunit [Chloroflexi bacterium AL-N15]
MPKRTDIQSILIIGSGPIVIGQACEFDYAGVQACKVLRREGYRIILVNSNPATIMTDPQFADATYIEPLTPEIVERIIEQEKPDAVLPTVGGQTGLNLAMQLHERGILERYGVELLGARPNSIDLAEDRQRFKDAMLSVGLEVPEGDTVTSIADALTLAEQLGYPVLVRPSFTMGGSGSGIATDAHELRDIADRGLRASPVHQILIEQSVLGWKEYELEVMRDHADNFVVVCSIENLDAMGVHTGDSITVAPSMTLTDRELQRLRNMAKVVMSTVGVETGGSNVQFAVNPVDGRALVIEMNPRVSRSSALASKATGFPIAKIAALLAVGYTLDEIPNDITKVTPASFEPSLDYMVVKIPRWAFEKFPGVDPTLSSQMKSVGEVMAIGTTFPEAFQKALRGLEIGVKGFDHGPKSWNTAASSPDALHTPTAERIFVAGNALRKGDSVEQVAEITSYDPWFVDQMANLIEMERAIERYSLDTLPTDLWLEAKQHGFSDGQLAMLLQPSVTEQDVRARRKAHGILPVYHRIDTCAAEFAAHTPYLYSTYATRDEADVTTQPKAIILGGGPNRIGQGLEFDYCCVHACFALNELGYETIMINCNPETVSTDYDIADRLYFEPLTLEDVLNVWEHESRASGVVTPVLVQFGGQTPLNLANGLQAAGVPIWGTSQDSIDLAEDRARFGALLQKLEIEQPDNGMASDLPEARQIAQRIGYPVLVRPSYVLGGRAMSIAYDDAGLAHFLEEATLISDGQPILIDRYLEDAFEVDVDAIGDGNRVVIGGIMEHVEEAGVHSGDSAMVMPPYKVSAYHLSIIRDETIKIGLALGVKGLMNIQFAIKDDEVYVLEVNPRSSRTVPFISKATGVPLASLAAQVASGKTLAELGLLSEPSLNGFFVKEAVLPFDKFPGASVMLSPEMRSTGEVMGHASTFGHAFAKAEMGAGQKVPLEGGALLTVNDFDKGAIGRIARDLVRSGFKLYGTRGTGAWVADLGIPIEMVAKASEGGSGTVELLASGKVQLVINTPLGQRAYADSQALRTAAIRHGVMLVTTLTGAAATVSAIRGLRTKAIRVRSLQDHYRESHAT